MRSPRVARRKEVVWIALGGLLLTLLVPVGFALAGMTLVWLSVAWAAIFASCTVYMITRSAIDPGTITFDAHTLSHRTSRGEQVVRWDDVDRVRQCRYRSSTEVREGKSGRRLYIPWAFDQQRRLHVFLASRFGEEALPVVVSARRVHESSLPHRYQLYSPNVAMAILVSLFLLVASALPEHSVAFWPLGMLLMLFALLLYGGTSAIVVSETEIVQEAVWPYFRRKIPLRAIRYIGYGREMTRAVFLLALFPRSSQAPLEYAISSHRSVRFAAAVIKAFALHCKREGIDPETAMTSSVYDLSVAVLEGTVS